ncbi:MAG: hypothetical protein KME29_07780 [Calothrix sp. FI2-JRJ7]|nr:hypothetical protein [Calothrix sp. FI2-JRJ7]
MAYVCDALQLKYEFDHSYYDSAASYIRWRRPRSSGVIKRQGEIVLIRILNTST